MPSKKKGLMGKLLRMNARWFLGALVCTLVCVVTDYLSPLIVAETLDRYLGNQESVLPPFLLRLMPVLSDRAYIVERLYLVGLLIILINLVNGVASYFKGRLQSIAGENVAKPGRKRATWYSAVPPTSTPPAASLPCS